MLEEVVLYPNPATDFLSLKGILFTSRIEIYDMNGRRILEKEVEKDATIEISHLAAGKYQVILRSGDQFIIKQLQIAR